MCEAVRHVAPHEVAHHFGISDARADRDGPLLTKSATITTERLRLVPLEAADAEEMAAVVSDEWLHGFVGGRPDTPGELRGRASGSPPKGHTR